MTDRLDKLTREDILVLRAPFPARHHKFNRGYAYLQEWALASRIEDVDPAWSMRHVETTHRNSDVAGKTIVTVTVELKIKNSIRIGVGMESVKVTKNKQNEANEAEKSAATDAFRRACRLFGMGRYLLRLPKNEGDMQYKDRRRSEAQLQEWLNSQSSTLKEELPQTENPRRVQFEDVPQPPQKQAPLAPTTLDEIDVKVGTPVGDKLVRDFNLYICGGNTYKARNSWKKIEKLGLIVDGMHCNEALQLLVERRAAIDADEAGGSCTSEQIAKILDYADMDFYPKTKTGWRELWEDGILQHIEAIGN